MALVRPTRQGISLASDGQGRLLGHKADYFVSEDQTLVVSVPTRGNGTVYAVVGDVFGYASAVGLVALAGAALRPRRGRRPRGDGDEGLRSDQAQGPAQRRPPHGVMSRRACGRGSWCTP